MNLVKKYWEVLIILFLGLTPLLWYQNPNSLALGHDMGFPIDPIVFFKDRLFLWTDRVGLGWDQTLGSAATLIHGLEAFVASLGFSIFDTQKIVFIFWFVLPGLAMYYFVSTIHKDKDEWFIRLSASLFYMFNHFLLQGWFIAERTKISLFIALPILLGLTISILEKRISTFKGLALMSLVFFFFNGGGGLPLYGGLLLTLTLAFLFFGFIQLRKNFRAEFKRLIGIAFGIFASFVLANFYWILPTAVNTLSSYKQSLISIGGISGVLAWSFEISKFASILNVIRLQGIPDWYDNPAHPYSKIFLDNPLLILVSFLIPIIVFSSLFLVKKHPQYRRYVIFFNLLAILGIIFTTGSHPPFGVIYNFFLSFIPGFAIFRTPFYKFAPALWFAYSYLFAFAAYFLIKELKKPKLIANVYMKNISLILIIVAILSYNFPFFTGSFFQWQKPFSTMTKLPLYVLDFDKWVNSNISYDDRVITFPVLNPDWYVSTYKWGYWSTASLASLITNKSVIANDRVMTSNELLLTNSFYNLIEKDTSVWKRISQLLGINYFLLQNDFAADTKQFGTVAPAFYKEKFNGLEGTVKKQSFGAWDLYQVMNNNPKKIFFSQKTSLVLMNRNLDDELFDANSVFYLPNSEGENFYITNESERNSIPTGNFSRKILIASCLYCDQKAKDLDLSVSKPQILPGSIFYQFVRKKEQKQEKALSINPSKLIDFYLGMSLKRLSEAKQLILLKDKDENINFTLGEVKKNSSKIGSLLDKMDKNNAATQLKILRVNNFLKGENRVLNDISQLNVSGLIASSVISSKDWLSSLYLKNIPFEFAYPPDTKKDYALNIEVPGNYEVLLQRQDFGQELSFQKILFDGRLIDSKPAVKNGYYFTLGKIFLTQGSHALQFEIDENNLFKNVDDFSMSPTNQACNTITRNNIYSNHKYILSFKYVTGPGRDERGPELKIEQFDNNKNVTSSILQLGPANSFQSFKNEIIPQNNVNKLRISLCLEPGYENRSTVSISSLSLKPESMPFVTAILDNTSETTLPDYSVDRINQTKYKVSVQNAKLPYFLVLNTAFNQNWKISFDDHSTLFNNKDKHLVINGFANGWLVDRQGDYSLTLEYSPQKYFYLGWIVTGSFILLVVGYLILVKHYESKN